MACFGGDLAQRHEDKIPQVEPGMRNDEVRRIDDKIPGKKDVDVDRPRALVDRRDTLHFGLYGFRQTEERLGFEIGSDLEDLIEEPGLVRAIHGLGLVDGRSPELFDAFAGEKTAGPSEVGRAPSQIAAQAQKVDHARSSPAILAKPLARLQFGRPLFSIPPPGTDARKNRSGERA
jgi:hypothetical protein